MPRVFVIPNGRLKKGKKGEKERTTTACKVRPGDGPRMTQPTMGAPKRHPEGEVREPRDLRKECVVCAGRERDARSPATHKIRGPGACVVKCANGERGARRPTSREVREHGGPRKECVGYARRPPTRNVSGPEAAYPEARVRSAWDAQVRSVTQGAERLVMQEARRPVKDVAWSARVKSVDARRPTAPKADEQGYEPACGETKQKRQKKGLNGRERRREQHQHQNELQRINHGRSWHVATNGCVGTYRMAAQCSSAYLTVACTGRRTPTRARGS
ncbi:hypothetical protein C8J57DRAFT_1222938 [Mycena rebaudengoi]|nr:hypothetical protein C8J57DRAFT_1222938 [Mycena rebaudengoi]